MSDPHPEIVALAKSMFQESPHDDWINLLENERVWWLGIATAAYRHVLASLMEQAYGDVRTPDEYIAACARELGIELEAKP